MPGDIPLSPEILLAAYARGYFPMAESRDDVDIFWCYPKQRGILPLDSFHVPRSLAKFMRSCPYSFTTDKAFDEVIRACAETSKGRDDTWINDTIIDVYCQLAKLGAAHSVECWQDGKLVGGLYGIALGGAFFGESMFSRATNASKASLVHLVGLLSGAGYTLLDTQFVNEHLKQFGVIEIAREDYLGKLEKALLIAPHECF